ncbi:MAG: HAMP domain-containing sensor histidine kinase [Syntrophotaleaceae bacterium]
MAKQVGLRTEIIFHITLLLGAALLFGGFLMLKLTERELLNQRLDSLSSNMDVLANSIGEALAAEDAESDQRSRVARLLRLLPDAAALGAWKVDGEALTPLYLNSTGDDLLSADVQLKSLRFIAEPQEQLVYVGTWLAWGEFPSCYFKMTLPIRQQGKLVGVLQARFPLDRVVARVRSLLKVLLLYVFLYGAVLFLFGLYLLNRNVVQPIGLLMNTTRRVAAGDLDQRADEGGPLEIASLARSFNAMVSSLRESRQRTDDHIRSLQQANEELRQTRGELLRSEKMASVGHLAAGMAHEIGNPLAAIVGYLELLRAELPVGRQREIADYAATEAGRIDGLVRELLDYAKPGVDHVESFDPLIVMREALALLDHQGVLPGEMLVDALPDRLPHVAMVPHRLLQVFINLLANARDASPEQGKIMLAAGDTAKGVWLSIADEGTGIAEEHLPHIFDPFYTTKAPGKGCGLGLAVCQRVVDEAGGAIEARSLSGRGSVFTIRLPKEGDSHAA